MMHTPLNSAIYPVHHPGTRLLLPFTVLLCCSSLYGPTSRMAGRWRACQKRVRRQSERLSGVCCKAPPPPTRVATCEQRVFFPPLLLLLQTHRSQRDEGGRRHARRVVDAPHNAQRNLDAVRNAASTQVQRKNFLPSAATARRSTQHQRPAASPEVHRPTASAAAQRSSE